MTGASVVSAVSLERSFAETVAIGVLLAVIVFVGTMWRRLAGVLLLIGVLLISAALHFEFADPAMAGGIEIAFGAPLLIRLRLLPFILIALSVVAFGVGERARNRRQS